MSSTSREIIHIPSKRYSFERVAHLSLIMHNFQGNFLTWHMKNNIIKLDKSKNFLKAIQFNQF